MSLDRTSLSLSYSTRYFSFYLIKSFLVTYTLTITLQDLASIEAKISTNLLLASFLKTIIRVSGSSPLKSLINIFIAATTSLIPLLYV
jgi:hypothetical protein